MAVEKTALNNDIISILLSKEYNITISNVEKLEMGSANCYQLEKDINGINPKMLLEQLDALREFGLVDKKNYEGYPLKVEYFLTEDRGQRIVKALEIMQEVGRQYLDEEIKKH